MAWQLQNYPRHYTFPYSLNEELSQYYTHFEGHRTRGLSVCCNNKCGQVILLSLPLLNIERHVYKIILKIRKIELF